MNDPSCLELTMAVPGLSTSSGSEGGGGGFNQFNNGMRDLDMNRPASASGFEEDYQTVVVENGHDISESSNRPKKLRLTKEQSRLLEESFKQNQTLNLKQKETLGLKLKLRPRQVEVWFQNRRARTKQKQTGMEYDQLRQFYGSLTEENRRLQKEVEYLRALHTHYEIPPSSLTMCPRCEKVTTTAAAAATMGKQIQNKSAGATTNFVGSRRPSSATC
ncbi:Homeobox-leucine zipper protein HOX3 [Zostera marina]|uniref:Homeobox-leucine zipper protein HOX3 n=1 Tax=Zostera marina TaxID=29655 RepID=A0A0K9PNC8_ZOSMR|nr:Homeobox-leucine zipper protein HOX3 [Zostera marina]